MANEVIEQPWGFSHGLTLNFEPNPLLNSEVLNRLHTSIWMAAPEERTSPWLETIRYLDPYAHGIKVNLVGLLDDS